MNRFIILFFSFLSSFGFSQVYINSPGGEMPPPPPGEGGGPLTPGAPASSIDMYLVFLFVFAVIIILTVMKNKISYERIRR